MSTFGTKDEGCIRDDREKNKKAPSRHQNTEHLWHVVIILAQTARTLFIVSNDLHGTCLTLVEGIGYNSTDLEGISKANPEYRKRSGGRSYPQFSGPIAMPIGQVAKQQGKPRRAGV